MIRNALRPHFSLFPRFGRTMTCCAAQVQVAPGKAFRDVERVADLTSQARSVRLCVCLYVFMCVCVYLYICMCVSVEPVEDLLRLRLTSSLCMFVCMSAFVYVCLCIFVYLYICMCVSVEPVKDLLRLCLTSSLSCSLVIVRNS